MKTKKILSLGLAVLLPLSAITLSSCDSMVRTIKSVAHHKTRHVQDLIEEERTFSSATSFEIRSSITVEFFYAPERKLIVAGGDQEQLSSIVTEEINGVLHIYSKSKRKSWSERTDMCAKIYTPDIKAISLSGATDAVLRDTFHLPTLELSLTGASDFEARVLDVQGLLSLNASGASDSYLAGQVGELTVNVSGSSDVNASHLSPLKRASVTASGSSDVELGEVQELSYHVSGASDLEYKGTPRILSKHSSGASTVSQD